MTAVPQTKAADTARTGSELPRFFIAAFAASWVVGGLGFLLFDLGVLGLALGTASLTVVTLALTRRVEGSVRPFMREVLRWRVPIRWYATAIGVPIIAIVAAVGLASLVGDRGVAAHPVGLGLALLLLPMQVAVGGLEEPAWRGYALPRLQRGRSALAAALILGAIWMLWHVPLFLVSNSLFDTTPFAAYAIVGLASSVVYSWIYNSTGGSVLLVMLLHAVKNTSLGWLAPTTAAWSVFAASWVVLAALVIVVFGSEHLASSPRHVRRTS